MHGSDAHITLSNSHPASSSRSRKYCVRALRSSLETSDLPKQNGGVSGPTAFGSRLRECGVDASPVPRAQRRGRASGLCGMSDAVPTERMRRQTLLHAEWPRPLLVPPGQSCGPSRSNRHGLPVAVDACAFLMDHGTPGRLRPLVPADARCSDGMTSLVALPNV